MRTLKLTIAYDGTRYVGWQIQKGRRPTIQGTLERVLKQILREPVKVVGSGRTDAGVHALAQVAHVRTHSAMPRHRLLRSVNALLPSDISVPKIEEAEPSFHARFHAVSKRYRYRIFLGGVVPPFIRPYVHHVPRPLNLSLMRREAAALAGRHDFRAFAQAARRRRGTIRRLTDIQVIRRGSELQVEVEGSGFLHTMVRSIVGTLLDVGRGRLPAGTIRRMLRRGDRRLAGMTAPAHGLALVSVTYPDETC
ncbi:MAG: tRNA pseudouridine(38-40) synthase TruA [Candidatus Omnitrophica bacterium]|nr:tRNA pseudouridine(38-40) synthase TruA [Candidatus Omnitrophota bacterium]